MTEKNKEENAEQNIIPVEEINKVEVAPQNDVTIKQENKGKDEPKNNAENNKQSDLKNEKENILQNGQQSDSKNEQQNSVNLDEQQKNQKEQPKEQEIVPKKEPLKEKPKEEPKNFIININKIEFDLFKIFGIIKKEGIYKENNFIFELYKGYSQENKEVEEKEDIPKYLVDIQSNGLRYLGILSNNLNKEVYGYNIFDNGDEYFGKWSKDKKEGFGIYYFKEKDEEKIKHIYIGDFKNNYKFGEGLYFKIKKFEEEKENKENINRPSDFTFAIGKFNKDDFSEGIIYNLEGEKRQIYRGKMNEKGEKTDENAEIYENNNQIFKGEIKNNIMIKGRIIILNEKENKKEEAYYFERKVDKVPNDEIEVDYKKGEEEDDKLIKKMNGLFGIYDCEKLKDLYVKAIEFREKIRDKDNFQYIKDLDYDKMIKDELKKMYGKYFYIDLNDK